MYAQIIDDDSIQDATAVVALIKSALEYYKKANPQITKVWIRSDNAAGKKVAILFQKVPISNILSCLHLFSL